MGDYYDVREDRVVRAHEGASAMDQACEASRMRMAWRRATARFSLASRQSSNELFEAYIREQLPLAHTVERFEPDREPQLMPRDREGGAL